MKGALANREACLASISHRVSGERAHLPREGGALFSGVNDVITPFISPVNTHCYQWSLKAYSGATKTWKGKKMCVPASDGPLYLRVGRTRTPTWGVTGGINMWRAGAEHTAESSVGRLLHGSLWGKERLSSQKTTCMGLASILKRPYWTSREIQNTILCCFKKEKG